MEVALLIWIILSRILPLDSTSDLIVATQDSAYNSIRRLTPPFKTVPVTYLCSAPVKMPILFIFDISCISLTSEMFIGWKNTLLFGTF